MSKYTSGFSHCRKKFYFMWLGAFFILSCWPGVPDLAGSQEILPRVSEVSVKIDGQSSPSSIKDLISVKKGSLFSLKDVNDSVKRLYKTGLFSDIQVLQEGGDSLHLIFLLKKMLLTRKIIILGKTEMTSNQLKDGLSELKEGEEFSEKRLERAREELKELLSKHGEFEADIDSLSNKDTENSVVDVVLRIQSFQRFKVRKITFLGELVLPEDQLRERMETKEGKRYVPSILDQDLEQIKMWHQNMGYRRVEVNVKELDFHKEEKEVSLALEVIPKEKLEIVVRGADVPMELLESIWETRIFEEWGLAEGEAKIVQYLRGKGHLFASVQSSYERDDHKVKIVYEVSPGEKYKIEKISFEGLEYFSLSQMQEKLRIQASLPFFSPIAGDRLFELPREIEFLYKFNGFPNPKIDLVFEKRKKKVVPIFIIEEGTQEKVQDIVFDGAQMYSRDRLLEQISFREGGPYYQPDVQKNVEELEKFYLNQGIRGTEVKAGIENKKNGFFSVRFHIKEGEKVIIANVVIVGNHVTRKNTILRELLIQEGDPAFWELIQESKWKLERLGIFSEVKIDEILLSENTENLLINVKEGKRNYAGLGLGLETRHEPKSLALWNTVVRPRGTAEMIRNNIFGSAARLSLIGQISIRERRGVLSWEQPYFFGLSLQTYLNAWLEQEERKSYSFDRRGLSLTVIQPLGDKESPVFLSTFRLARTTLFELRVSESEIDRQHYPFSTSSLSGSLIWDRRDDLFNPTQGYFFSSVIEWAYPLFNAESNFQKSFSKYQHYIPLIPGLTLATTARLGLGRGRIPIHERFFAGGSNSFRGTEFDELGPKDVKSLRPVGGKGLVLFNFELLFPLPISWKNASGVLFYDAGNVFETRRQVSLSAFQNAIGAGLRYKTPLGPIRLEAGWNLNAPEGEKKVHIFITIGNVF